jgi:leader peptidase (prepilin peptidase)/N-methyltransferase
MIIAYVAVLLLGLVVGSFLGVCIYRLPKNESIINPPSHCASCNQPLKWFENIPIISFIVLGGQCRYCQKRIPLVNLSVELISGIIAVYLFSRFGFTLNFILGLIFFSSLIVASFIDFRYQVIPDSVSVSALLLIFIIKAIQSFGTYGDIMRKPIVSSIGGAIFAGGLVYLIIIIFNFILFDIIATIYKKRGKVFYLLKKFDNEDEASCMGLGDVTLMALIGSLLGVQGALMTFIIAPFIGSVIGIVILATKRDHIIPYGPFLSLAALVVFIWQDQILAAVNSFLCGI